MVLASEYGDNVTWLIILSPLILFLLSLVVLVVMWAFGAGVAILGGIMSFLTRPVQSLLWVIKWVLLICASFAALWGFIWLFYPDHRLHGGLILAGAVAAGFMSVLCEIGRDWLKEKAKERAERRQLKRELKQHGIPVKGKYASIRLTPEATRAMIDAQDDEHEVIEAEVVDE